MMPTDYMNVWRIALLAFVSVMTAPAQAYCVNQTDQECDDEVYSSADVMPRYIDGESAMYDYIKSNIQYPEEAKAEGIECNVVLQFVVMKDGSVGEVKLIGDYAEEFSSEAIRVIKSLPGKFKPGCKGGRKVNVWFTQVVSFKLEYY